VSTSGTGTTTPDQATSGREPFLRWYAHKPIAWVGTGVAVAGLGVGITFTIVRANASSNADSIARQIRNFASDHAQEIEVTYPRRDPQDPSSSRADDPCGPREDPSGDVQILGFPGACNKLRDELDTYDSALPWAITGWVLFGVGVVGTATYAMVDWYPQKQKTALEGPRLTAVAPVVAPGQAGIGLAGTF
jgi:hypothetical protein